MRLVSEKSVLLLGENPESFWGDPTKVTIAFHQRGLAAEEAGVGTGPLVKTGGQVAQLIAVNHESSPGDEHLNETL